MSNKYDGKSQVPRTLRSFLTDPCNAYVYMVFIIPLLSCSLNIFSKFWGIDIRASIITNVTAIILQFLALWQDPGIRCSLFLSCYPLK